MDAVTTEEKVASLKGRMISITALEINSPNLEQINELLKEKAKLAPAFFNGAPLLMDITHLEEKVDSIWLKRVSAIINENGFIPVGIVGADKSMDDIARASTIPVWPSGGSPRNAPRTTEEDTTEVTSEPEITEHNRQDTAKKEENPENQYAPPLVLKTPVRSGQRVYAKGGDLIILSSVNTGAEVMADGHIHVYGALRGRALAGIKGHKEARIFCHSLQADLVAIAGYYLTNEDLPADKRGNAVQIALSQEDLIIDTL